MLRTPRRVQLAVGMSYEEPVGVRVVVGPVIRRRVAINTAVLPARPPHRTDALMNGAVFDLLPLPRRILLTEPHMWADQQLRVTVSVQARFVLRAQPVRPGIKVSAAAYTARLSRRALRRCQFQRPVPTHPVVMLLAHGSGSCSRRLVTTIYGTNHTAMLHLPLVIGCETMEHMTTTIYTWECTACNVSCWNSCSEPPDCYGCDESMTCSEIEHLV